MSTWVMIDRSSTATALPNIIPPKFPLIHSVTSTVYSLPGCVYSVVTFVASINFRPDLSRLFSSKPPPQIIEMSDRAVTTINREINERAPLEDDDHAEASWTFISCAKRGVIYIGRGTVVGGAKIITKVVTTTVFSSVVNPWIMSCERNARRCIIPLAIGVFLNQGPGFALLQVANWFGASGVGHLTQKGIEKGITKLGYDADKIPPEVMFTLRKVVHYSLFFFLLDKELNYLIRDETFIQKISDFTVLCFPQFLASQSDRIDGVYTHVHNFTEYSTGAIVGLSSRVYSDVSGFMTRNS